MKVFSKCPKCGYSEHAETTKEVLKALTNEYQYMRDIAIECDITYPLASYHLKLLVEKGFAERIKHLGNYQYRKKQ